MDYKILIADDEPEIRNLLRLYLENENYHVIEAEDGQRALDLLRAEQPALCILDIMMPKIDGYHVLQQIRKESNIPVIILSAKDADSEKILGLNLGADDYLAKPFHLEELAARIRSLTRRQFTQNDLILTCGRVAFDTKSRTATADGQALTLTRKEMGILEYLLLNQGRPVSQEELIDHVWDNSVDNFSNSIRVHISALRKKLRFALGYDPIRNRIGEGYIMEEEKS